MGGITANVGDEGSITWRIELHFKEGRTRIIWIILVAIRGTGILRERTRIAKRHAKPERNLILQGLRGWQRALLWQGEGILDIVARPRNCRVKLGSRLVMAHIMAVVEPTTIISAGEIGANLA